MTIIPPTKPATTSIGATRARRPVGGFNVAAPSATAERANVPTDIDIGAASGVEAVHLGDLLALQETGPESPRDRAARRHGQQMLDLLRDLQLAALSAMTDPETLPRLTRLATAMPSADDPGLSEVLDAIAVRAAVELARRDVVGPSSPAPR